MPSNRVINCATVKVLEKPASLIPGPKTRALVETELSRILESEPFRESRRCQEFLRYVISLALDGRQEEIKERAIGIDVFSRAHDYNTNDDSIVRVKASEVRKRLAQYHLLRQPDQRVRIELPPGSYVPEISWISPPPPEEDEPVSSRRRYLWYGAGALGLAGAAGLARRFTSEPGGYTRFWEPVLRAEGAVLICLGHPVVYLLSQGAKEKFQPGASKLIGPDAEPVDLKGSVDASEIYPAPNQFVGYGDALTAVQVSSTLARFGRASQTRIGDDVSFSELRNSAVVLIGAFSNRWTMQLDRSLRYVFDMEGSARVIRDRAAPHNFWSPPERSPIGRVSLDYAIVSRVQEPQSGQIIVIAAGITQFGCQAAAEFLSRPGYLDRAVEGLPSGWQTKNLQFVIRAKVMGSASVSAPEVVARHAG
jgi:hypothetical protein